MEAPAVEDLFPTESPTWLPEVVLYSSAVGTRYLIPVNHTETTLTMAEKPRMKQIEVHHCLATAFF